MSNTSQDMFSDGAAYERLMGRWSRVAGDQFITWLALPGGLRWLDVGCGNGAFTEEIVGRCAPAAVAGIDPSPGQIDYARTRPCAHMVEFQVGDSQALPFPDASFDVATMALVIAFVPDPPKGVSELFRILAPGGTAAAYMWDLEKFSGPQGSIYQALNEMGISAPRPPSAPASRMEAMTSLWHGAGFQQVESTVIPVAVSFSDFEDFWTSTTLPVGPLAKFVNALPDEAKAELRRRLRDRLPTAPDGRIAYEALANAVKGQRRG